MDLEELKVTDEWTLFEKGKSFMRRMNMFTDTDKNYRMYSGNQWEGAKIEGIEQAQYNFIETIVNYKVSTINQNLWGINYSSENFEDREFRKTAEETCKLLNKKASKVWEKDSMDFKVREVSEDSAVNDEGVMYVNYDIDTQEPLNEIINKTDIQYGNENSSDIQSQPYIIISQRKSVIEIQNLARKEGVSEEQIKNIKGDSDYFEEAGESAKYEKDNKCTLITKMWKEEGKVKFVKSTKYVVVKKESNSGLSLYPVAHYPWKTKKGSARGEGEVRYLIPNQLELNKTLARMLLSVKQNAYPTKVVAIDKISNPNAINQVGGTIKARGQSVDDVNKVFTTIAPAQMSTDVSKTINDLISITRELKNSSDIATGGVNPTEASGKAILAVQQASQQPMTKQLTGLKIFIEDLARIWLDMWVTYSQDGMKLEEEKTDPTTGEEYVELVDIPSSVLENLKGTVKVDITPKSSYDKYARELTLENFLKAGYFNPQKLGELKVYAKILPDDAIAPKQDILKAIEIEEEEQKKIAQINAQAQIMQQRASQFINGDVEQQASQIADAQNMEETPIQ
nr:MAG TPA: Portal protein, Peptidoglycan hydrolase gp4, portal, tailspike, adhesin, VIRAL.5A [Caudoviricetes sp.]